MNTGLALAFLLSFPLAQATSARDVLSWEARKAWNEFAQTSNVWSKQWSPYSISPDNRKLVKSMSKQFHDWERVMKQLGDM